MTKRYNLKLSLKGIQSWKIQNHKYYLEFRCKKKEREFQIFSVNLCLPHNIFFFRNHCGIKKKSWFEFQNMQQQYLYEVYVKQHFQVEIEVVVLVVHIHYNCTLDILFSSNHNIHKSSCGLCFWASDPFIYRFY